MGNQRKSKKSRKSRKSKKSNQRRSKKELSVKNKPNIPKEKYISIQTLLEFTSSKKK